ncbi:maltase 1-like [Planococcus citri]|uniref:maltase 1-like n=1 Tax=Planococcus citri TaxID=170843 RepID=UPI0031F77842
MKFFQILIASLFVPSILALDKTWWKHACIYEIYLKSFKDSDGDGIGDLKGLISKLNYLADIGIDTIYMPPFFPSSKADGGYDITDFKGIDPIFGTMEDFEQLMKEMKSRGLYFLIDLVINHSSDEHEWFQKSIDRIDPYTDYYVWADPKGYDSNKKPIPPNNWFSIFHLHESGSAWTWNDKRKQFYLRHFTEKQPDLNLRNNAVKAEVKDIIKFWLEKGVTGFRVDAPMLLLEDEHLQDHPPLKPEHTLETIFAIDDYKTHVHHPDTFKFINELHQFVAQYDKKSRKSTQTALIGETFGSAPKLMKYYGTRRFPVFDLPFNTLLTCLKTYLDAHQLHDFLRTWLDQVPKGLPSNWALGNHDNGRLARAFDVEYNSILLALVAMLPGIGSVYYGEELSIGANNLVQMDDAYNRFTHRSPMHWDDSRNAGFTSAEKPWLPVHPNYWQFNVETQMAHENSSLHYFKDLMSFRKTDTFKYGDLKFHIVSKWILAFSRTHKRTRYITIMNLGAETEPIDLYANLDNVPPTMTVAASGPNSGYKKGSIIKTTPNYPTLSVLRPHSALILESIIQ